LIFKITYFSLNTDLGTIFPDTFIKHMKPTLSIALIFAFNMVAFCQKKLPGYIITSKNDTLKGLVKRPAKIDFDEKYTLLDSLDNKQYFIPSEMKGYAYTENNELKEYRSFIVRKVFGKNKYTLLQKLLSGELSVFVYHWGVEYSGTSYYIVDTNENIEILNFNTWPKEKRNLLKKLFLGCPLMSDKFKGDLNEKTVLKLISEYNQCAVEKFN
jgi:hypothetical protein